MMNREFKKYIVRILKAAGLMVVIAWVIFTFLIPEKYLPVLPLMLLFFTIVAILSHGYQLRLAKKDMGKFTRSSMLISMLRLLLYSAFAMVYMAINQEHVVVFVISLVLVYSVYTVLEILDLSRNLRRK